MSIALLENRLPRVGTMKSSDAMYDATLQECLQRPFYLFARGKGRACRKEIWMFSLFVWIINRGLSGLFGSGVGAILSGVFSLVCFVPQCALTVRRLHDVRLSGWLAVIPQGLSVVAVILLSGLDKFDDPSPLTIIVLLVAVVSQLVIMCLPSRYPQTAAMKENADMAYLGQEVPVDNSMGN